MKIVVAPNAFKHSMTASQAARAIKAGLARVASDLVIVEVPVCDGGDGFLEVVVGALQGEICEQRVRGPRDEDVEAAFGYEPSSDLAIVEMALASGLALLPEGRRDPTMTGTFGTGELIRAALGRGAKRILIGVGGSATNDGGIGVAEALGARFFAADGSRLAPIGSSLGAIERFDLSGLDPRIPGTELEVFCDVHNVLVGEKGAARVYGPQKGANPAQVEELDSGLAHLASIIESELELDVRNLPAAGAAGGLGAGLHAFLGARLRKGIDGILELLGLSEMLEGADLVITGEGRLDTQTMAGKAPAGVAAMAAERGIPCLALVGSFDTDLDQVRGMGFDAVFSICAAPMALDRAMKEGELLLERTSEQALRCFLAGRLGSA